MPADNGNDNRAAISSGSSLTYTLNTAAHTLGYNITTIDIFTEWNNNGRVNPNVTVSYALVGSPTTFVSLGYCRIRGGWYQYLIFWTKSDLTGNLASGVAAIKFDFGNQQNGYVGYSELDVLGHSYCSRAGNNDSAWFGRFGSGWRKRRA